MSDERRKQIEQEAETYAFQVPYDGTNDFYNDDKYNGYIAGRTAAEEDYIRMKKALEAIAAAGPLALHSGDNAIYQFCQLAVEQARYALKLNKQKP